MSLCGSFAVVPAFAVATQSGGARASGASLVSASTSAIDPASVAAFGVSEAATLALARPQAAATVTAPISVVPPRAAVPAVVAPLAAPVTPPAVVMPAAVVPAMRGPASAVRSGQATWLDTIPTGTCANNDAPMGAVITVTNTLGASITCRVVSRGPFATGRIVDVAKSTFKTLGTTAQGVVSVAVSW